MRFALLGDHADGLEMARALARTGRHELAVYSGPALGADVLRRGGLTPALQGDIEEVLADPAVALVIVAGSLTQRPGQLRRALQSERHVLCVHPAADSPDVAYEAAMLQAETGKLLLPLLPEALHPALRRFAEVGSGVRGQETGGRRRQTGVRSQESGVRGQESEVRGQEASDHIMPGPAHAGASPAHPLTVSPPHHFPISGHRPLLLEIERCSNEDVLLEANDVASKPSFPGWEALRLVGGDIGEVMAYASAEEADPSGVVLLAGQFVAGGLFQATYLPDQAEPRFQLSLLSATGRTELLFPDGWPGAAQLTYVGSDGTERTERWEAIDPWPALVAVFEDALTAGSTELAALGWLDEIRALELDDAARRSLERRRASTLDFQEVTEEATFKGAMTLVGCSLLWISLLLLILSVWVPWLGWIIAPVFGVFLAMQLLKLLLPAKQVDK